ETTNHTVHTARPRRPATGIRIHAETTPRCRTGTGSGTEARREAIRQDREACTKDQPTSTPRILLCRPRRIRPRQPRTAPARIQGRRRPKRPVVRSDRAPTRGVPTMAKNAPSPVIQAREVSLPSGSMRATCSGNRTWSGPKKAIHMPRLAMLIPVTHSAFTGRVGSDRAVEVVGEGPGEGDGGGGRGCDLPNMSRFHVRPGGCAREEGPTGRK